jgi:hypothetical protein
MVRWVLIDQGCRNTLERGDVILTGTCPCGSARLCLEVLQIHKIGVYSAEIPGGCESLGVRVLDGTGVTLTSLEEADLRFWV